MDKTDKELNDRIERIRAEAEAGEEQKRKDHARIFSPDVLAARRAEKEQGLRVVRAAAGRKGAAKRWRNHVDGVKKASIRVYPIDLKTLSDLRPMTGATTLADALHLLVAHGEGLFWAKALSPFPPGWTAVPLRPIFRPPPEAESVP